MSLLGLSCYAYDMCGFLGSFSSGMAEIDDAEILNLSKSISHRGPDSHKIIQNNLSKVIHHRLQITGGISNQQPVLLDNGDLFVFNGEIYNTSALISRFHLNSDPDDDAQVFAEIWSKFGPKYLAEIDGVFAGAHISERERRMYLFRDRFGARPLFYHHTDNRVIFSSEIHPLVDAATNSEINFETIYDFLLVNMPLTNETIKKNIFEIPPASLVTFDLDSKRITKRSLTYWEYQWSNGSLSIKALSECLDQSITSQIPKEVDFGSYLSGGIDSSLIAHFLSIRIPKLRTYTLAFDGYVDEYEAALSTANSLGSDLTRVLFSEKFALSHLNRVLKSIQTPRVGQSMVNFRVHEEASAQNKVMFSGAGADELFAGYPWRYPLEVNDNQVVPTRLSYSESILWIMSKWGKIGDTATLQNLFPDLNVTSVFEDRVSRLRINMPSASYDPTDPWAAVKLSMMFDQKNFLPHLLTVDDSLAMQFGLEVRVPYLSNQTISYASQIPIEDLFGVDQENGSIVGKIPLRKVAQIVFGERLSKASKLGFSAPAGIWAKPLGSQLMANTGNIWQFASRSYFKSILDNMTSHNDRQISSIVWALSALSHHLD
jgi:asparagine synthase (glutamine-hydrolysing)